MGLSLCVIFVVASILTRKISKPIRYLLDLMNRLATGDYSKKVGAHNWGYEFKVLANKLIRRPSLDDRDHNLDYLI